MNEIIKVSIMDKNDKVWRTNLIQHGFFEEYNITLISDDYDYRINVILRGEPSFFALTSMINDEIERREAIQKQSQIEKWIEDVEYGIQEFLDEVGSTYIFEEEELTYENMKRIKEKVEDILSCGDDLLYYLNEILEG